MSKVKVKSTSPHRKNMTVTFPVVGDIHFDENCIGEIEIDDSKLASFIKEVETLRVINEKKKSEKDTTDEDIKDGDIQLLSFPELKGIAKEAGYPEEEWKSLKKQPLIDYIKNKLAE